MLADRARVAWVITGASVAALAWTLLGDSPERHRENAAARALAMWSRSCTASSDGLCISREPAKAAHCGPDGAEILVVRSRSALEVMAAKTELARIATQDRPLRHHDFTMAKLALADDELERYLGLSFPAGLDFGPEGSKKAESTRRFDTWIHDKTEMAQRLRSRYLEIAALGDPAASIIAMSRVGLVAESFSDALFTAEIPVDVRTGDFAEDKIDAYCDALTTVAETFEPQAVDAFSSCVTRARDLSRDDDLGAVSDAARPCLEALSRLRPEAFPPIDEVFRASERTRRLLQLGLVDDVDVGVGYDHANARGVALRIKRDFDGAHRAYEQALALDGARPDAPFNLGLLETFEASESTAKEQTVALEMAAEHYRLAAAWFAWAAAHATGVLRTRATDHWRDAEKVRRQLLAYRAQLIFEQLDPETHGEPQQDQ